MWSAHPVRILLWVIQFIYKICGNTMKCKFNLRTQSMYMFTTVIKYFLTLINVRCLVFTECSQYSDSIGNICQLMLASSPLQIFIPLLCICVLYIIRNSNIRRIGNFPLQRLFENSTKLITISSKVICEMRKIPIWWTLEYVLTLTWKLQMWRNLHHQPIHSPFSSSVKKSPGSSLIV